MTIKTSTKELLKPLFCTADINLGTTQPPLIFTLTSNDNFAANAAVTRLPAIAFFDSRVGGVPFKGEDADYQAQIVANGQFVKGVPGKCEALGRKKLLANTLTVASLNRTTARGMPILEFQETVASDTLSVLAVQPQNLRVDHTVCANTVKVKSIAAQTTDRSC
jgi:hypothetical protein